jgi:hypothetical protein
MEPHMAQPLRGCDHPRKGAAYRDCRFDDRWASSLAHKAGDDLMVLWKFKVAEKLIVHVGRASNGWMVWGCLSEGAVLEAIQRIESAIEKGVQPDPELKAIDVTPPRFHGSDFKILAIYHDVFVIQSGDELLNGRWFDLREKAEEFVQPFLKNKKASENSQIIRR